MSTYKKAMKEARVNYLTELLRKTDGERKLAARIAGFSYNEFCRLLRAENIKAPAKGVGRPPIPRAMKEEVLLHIKHGMPSKVVASHYRISYETVRRIAREAPLP